MIDNDPSDNKVSESSKQETLDRFERATTYVSRSTLSTSERRPSAPHVSRARERVRRRYARGRKPGGEWAWLIIGGAILSVAAVIATVMALIYSASQTEQEVLPTAALSFANTIPDDSQDTELVLRTGQNLTLDNGYNFILEPWDGRSRFTLLLLGLDRRPDEPGLAYRTDTMILLSLDPTTNTVGMLNIPRDLFVAVPGFEAQRQQVNTTLALGEGRQPGTGPELSLATIQYNLGMHVHDYLIVDFNAVIGLIDAIGGIDVSTDYIIDDPQYPDMNFGYDPFYLSSGEHHLDGRNALKFARTRHGDSDLERAGRQQQVINAIRARILNLNMLPQLILQAPNLLSNFQGNVYTSLNLEEMIELAWYLKDIPQESISMGVIDYRYMSSILNAQNTPILIPNNDTIGDLLVEVFGPNYSE